MARSRLNEWILAICSATVFAAALNWTLVLQTWNLIIDHLMDGDTDPEVDKWFLMQSPKPVLFIILCYLLTVLVVGPFLMKNRKPFDLTKILLFYNFFQVLFSFYIGVTPYFIKNGISYYFTHLCNPIEGTSNPISRDLKRSAWLFLILKHVDLLDTIFFVLRKKRSHISFLHVYHHSVAVLGTWWYLKYMASEQGVIIGVLNSTVHTVMYGYYFVAALGPRFRKYLWWKKYLTIFQMLQFVVYIAYCVLLLIMDCALPKIVTVLLGINIALFLALFYHFYLQAYGSGKKLPVEKSSQGEIDSGKSHQE